MVRRRAPRNQSTGGESWSPEDIEGLPVEDVEAMLVAREARETTQARDQRAGKQRGKIAVVAGQDAPETAAPPAADGVLKPHLPLQGLTSKQEKYAVLFVSGLSKSAAYREAYEVGADTAMETVYRAALTVSQNPKVMARIAQLQTLQHERASYSVEQMRGHVVDTLLQVLFDEKSSASAKLKASELIGKIPGVDLFKEDTRDPVDNLTPDQLQDKLHGALLKLLGNDLANPQVIDN